MAGTISSADIAKAAASSGNSVASLTAAANKMGYSVGSVGTVAPVNQLNTSTGKYEAIG
jgi:hypothetical protein